MKDVDGIADNTPVLVGSGQVVRREAGPASPMELAAEAARRAIAHAGGAGLAAAIDTVSVTRLFSDSMGMPECPFGRSDNPPMSVARAIGAQPAHCIYGQVGGSEPQNRVIEFAADIARGERTVVLLAGAEATRNQRSAERAGQVLDWNETVDGPLEDRGWGELFVTVQEVSNGLLAPVFYFALIEQAHALAMGRNVAQHRACMAGMLAPFSEVAATNPYAQFPLAQSADEILAAAPLNHLYSKRMIARDSVNQGAALLMCSVAAARELGIPREHWIFLHGLASGEELRLSERDDPARSLMAQRVLARTLELAERTVAEISLIDIYSCFPCAVSTVAEFLGLPTDGSRQLTLTGGLPYFGGAGNNYSMHALAAVVEKLRDQPEEFSLVTSLGGVFSKYAAGIYSRQPSVRDWAAIDTVVGGDSLPRRTVIDAPDSGHILSWVLNYHGAEPAQVMVLAETGTGQRFVATTAPGDQVSMSAMQDQDLAGRAIAVASPQNGALYFSLA